MIENRLARRLGIAVLVGGLAIGTPVALLGSASADHTGPNGAVRTGPDLVFVDCAQQEGAPRTTTQPEQEPVTTEPGRSAQSAQTGSGCTTQAQAGGGKTLTARFTIDGNPAPARQVVFTLPDTDAASFPASYPPQTPGTTPTPNGKGAGCTTNANGECSVFVTRTSTGTSTVTGREQSTNETATINVEFRTDPTTFGRLTEVDRVVVQPAGDDYRGTDCTPGYSGSNGGAAGTGLITDADASDADVENGCAEGARIAPSGTPGRPVQVTYQLRDNGGTTDFPAGCGAPPAPPCIPGAGTTRPPAPLRNTQVTISVTSSAFFLTPNCGSVTFADNNATAPNRANAPVYTRCSFSPQPANGADAGEFRSLGTSQVVTSDDAGRVTVTVATERNSGLDDDGRVAATVTGTVAGVPTRTGSVPNGDDTANAPINFNTRNRPLNGEAVEIRLGGVAGSSATATPPSAGRASHSASAGVPGTGTVVSRSFTTSTGTAVQSFTSSGESIKLFAFLTDQWNNLVKVPETDASIVANNGAVLTRDCTTAGPTADNAPFGTSVCQNPAGPNTNYGVTPQPNTTPAGSDQSNQPAGSREGNRTTGSYTAGPTGSPSDPRTDQRDVFTLRATQAGPVTVTVNWQAPRTVFSNVPGSSTSPSASVSPSSSVSPSASASASVSPSASASVSPSASASASVSPSASPSSSQPARVTGRIVIASSHSRVTAGNAPTINGQVFDTNGSPLGGVNVTLFEKSFGETAYSPSDSGQATSASDGRFSIVVRPINQTSYGANSDDGRANSNVVQIRVNARMDINSPAPNALVSNPVTLSGRLLPAYNNRPIGLAYINAAGRYVYLGQANSVNGAWSVRAGGQVPSGTYTFVVYMSPTQGTDKGARSVRLSVR